MARFSVTETTTLVELDNWMGLRPNIETAKIIRPKGDSLDPTRGYRAIFEVSNNSSVIGESSSSVVKALDSAVSHIEELFPL